MCCRNYSLGLLRVPDEWWTAAEWSRGLKVRRRGEESCGCGCRDEWLQSSKSFSAYLCVLGVSPLAFLPSFPLFPPSSPLGSTPLSSLLHAFTQSLSSCKWLPCPLHALWLWLSLLHPPPPLSRTLYKYPIKWIMRSAVLRALPGVRCSPWLECQFTVWYCSSLNLHIWLMRLMVYLFSTGFLVTFLNFSWATRSSPSAAF